MKNLKQVIFDQLKQSGKIFSVTFVKKNGKIRTMNARFGVSKGVNGKGLSYDPKTVNNVIVFSMNDNGFRTFNLDSVLYIKNDGLIINF